MSKVAERTGIGRATLYKYFADVESVLAAWHERQVGSHVQQLARLRERGGDAEERLAVVLEAYALMLHDHRGDELAAWLHRGPHVVHAHCQLRAFTRDLLAERARAGLLREDVAPDELAAYCLHALGAAAELPSKAAVRRLVAVTLSGLRSPRA